MKICIITHSFPRFKGDTATPFMGNLAESLGKVATQIFILTPYDPKIKTKNRGPFKIITYKYIFPRSLHLLGYARTFQSGKNLNMITYLLSPFMYLFGFLALLKLVKKEKIDLISAHWMIPNGFIARLVNIITQVPYTVTIPGADVHMGGENELFRQMVGFASLGANWVISDSPYYITQLNQLGFYPKKISIIRYGVNTTVFKIIPQDKILLKQLGIKPEEKVVLAVGRLVAQKGFIYLIKAFAQVLEQIPSAKLVIVGDGYEKVNLINEVNKLKIESQVIFPGTISYDQLIKFYNLADVFAMPSIKDQAGNLDASPVAMMEAMACGVPVIATKFAGNEDLVINDRTGYLVKEKSSQEIAEAIIKLSKKADKRQIQQQVRQIAIANFSIRQITKRYLEIFKKINSQE